MHHTVQVKKTVYKLCSVLLDNDSDTNKHTAALSV